MEHLNRFLKSEISSLGSNKTENSIQRLGKAIGTLAPIIENIDNINGIIHHETRHTPSSMKKDIIKVVSYLQESRILKL